MPAGASLDIALQRAASLSANNQLDEAAEVLRAELHTGGQPLVMHRLALLEARRGRWAEAEVLARSAVVSGDDQYACTLGQVLLRVGKQAEARDFFDRAVAYDPRNAWAHAGLATVYQDQRNLAGALASFDSLWLFSRTCPG